MNFEKQNQGELIESEMPVPFWQKEYAYSVSVLNSASPEQKAFYDYFKQSFLNGRIFDVRGNTNYVFALMFDLIQDFHSHQDEQLVVQQLTELENAYPVIKPYTEKNLTDAIEGDSDEINLNLYDIVDEIIREMPELSEKYSGIDRDYDSDEDESDDDDYDDDDDDNIEIFRFPPTNPTYTVTLTETFSDDYVNVETSIAINGKLIDALKAEVQSIKADLESDRLFVHTSRSRNEDSSSIFCFEFSTGRRLWQTTDIDSSGSLYIDKQQKLIEAGKSRVLKTNYLALLDYNGNVLERNFRDIHKMIRAADEKLKNGDYGEAKNLFLKAREASDSHDATDVLDTKIKISKKLARIGKLTGDYVMLSNFTQEVSELELEKTAKKNRRAEKSARQLLSLSERLAMRSDDDDESDDFEDDPELNNFFNKRWNQAKEEGGK